MGFFLRIYNLSENPPGLFADEAANGYIAYSLLTTGHDDHGKKWPFFFESFGDWRTPVYIYSTIPFVAIFGLNEFSARLPSAVYGTLTILALYLLGKQLFNKSLFPPVPSSPSSTFHFLSSVHCSHIPLLTSLLLAVSPWHIHLSRTGFEFIPFPFFFILSLYLFLLFLDRKISFTLPAASFALTLYTYYPTFLQTPLFLLFLILIFRPQVSARKKEFFGFLVVFLLFALPFFYGIKSGKLLTRWQNVQTKQSLTDIAKNYLNHFSPDFLFFKGDIDFPGHFITRHSVRGMGQLYLWQAPLIIIGAVFLLLKIKDKSSQILLFWLLLYPLGSVFTAGGPFATRSLIGVIPFQILSALGIAFFFSRKSIFYFLSSVFFLLVLTGFSRYLRLYFRQYPIYAADFWGWQYGPREIMKYFLENKDSYDELYMSGEFNSGEIFLKFYDPENSCQDKCKMGDFWRQPRIVKKNLRQLFSLSPEYLNNSSFKKDFLLKKEVLYPDGKTAFLIGELANIQKEITRPSRSQDDKLGFATPGR